MEIQVIKNQLTSIRFACQTVSLRNGGKITCKSQRAANNFAILFLVEEAVCGVDFTDRELLEIYDQISKLVQRKNMIKISEIPFAAKKERPPHNKTLFIEGVTVSYK